VTEVNGVRIWSNTDYHIEGIAVLDDPVVVSIVYDSECCQYLLKSEDGTKEWINYLSSCIVIREVKRK